MNTGATPRMLLSLSAADRGIDELVAAVRLDLEDVEPPVERVVGLRGEPEGSAEDPVLDDDLLHLLDHIAPVLDRSVAGVAGTLDRVEDHLDRPVRRRTERAERGVRVVLLPAGDDVLVVREQV